MADDILVNDELGMFCFPEVVNAIKEVVIGEGKTVFVVEADNEEDHDAERNLHKRAVILPYVRYIQLMKVFG